MKAKMAAATVSPTPSVFSSSRSRRYEPIHKAEEGGVDEAGPWMPWAIGSYGVKQKHNRARHLSLLKWFGNGGSERRTFFNRSAFQEVFSCLVDVHLNHLPFEFSPLGHQHLQIKSQTSYLISLQTFITLKKNHNWWNMIADQARQTHSQCHTCLINTPAARHSGHCEVTKQVYQGDLWN
ncbi:hypothetical protein EYF80_009772 [Liparis tanakae]|uniref:Uncharacterized protein n=1 Tax=Liparis tanakae TaxID=230148 RepID=A0A4Z2IPX8_9TELE|nr:hypothetical protein EYF80_009772 [Liparis tanakae]